MQTIFETARLRVRSFTADDHDNLYLLHGNADVMRYIRPVKTKAESDAMLNEVLAATYPPGQGRWAVEEKGTGIFVGNFVLVPIPSEPDKIQLGYSFTPANWGKGYATELSEAGLAYFFHESPLPEIYGVTETPNIASQKVLLKAGFAFHERKMEGEKELTIFIARR